MARIISDGPVARYVKACNQCCWAFEFVLGDMRYLAESRRVRFIEKMERIREGFYVVCPNRECMHASWVGEDEPDVVARCRVYEGFKSADMKELKR